MDIGDSAGQRPPAAATLTVTTTRASTVVTATGELDNAITERLQECLIKGISARPRAFIMDLSRVSFCSAGTVRVLLTAHSHARAEGIACAVVSSHRAVVRPISALGLGHLLLLHPDIAAAEEWLSVALDDSSPAPNS
jgi:anti-sigma B factor antagonist